MRSTLTAAEVAELLGCATSTIHAQAKAGTLPCIRLGDRTLFPKAAMEHYARTGTLPAAGVGGGEGVAARLLLEVERRTAEARLAAIDDLLAGMDQPKPEPTHATTAPPARPAKRCSRVVVREV